MALTHENDTALHEAGHAIIAYLISDIFEFMYVTSNVNFSRAHDCTSKGGLRGRLIKGNDELTFEDCDKMFLLFLAGFVADEINNSNCNIEDSFYDNSVWATKMNSVKYSGDKENFIPFLALIQNKYGVQQRKYTICCQELLYDIFTTDWITNLLLEIRYMIETAESQTVTGEEITRYLDATNLRSWKNTEWNSIVNSRKERFFIESPKKVGFLKKFFSLFQ